MENFPKLINVQDGIRLCRLEFSKNSTMKSKFSGKFSKIDKCAGWSKAVQVGIFKKNNTTKSKFSGKFSKISKCAGWSKAVQVGLFQKNNKLYSTFIR